MYVRVTCIYVIELVWATDFLIYGKLSTDGWDHLEISSWGLYVHTYWAHVDTIIERKG